jgi:hypothetical protein
MMMWDAFQREVLGAMGHTLLVPVAGQASDNAAAAMPRVRVADADADADAGARPALLRALALAAGIDDTRPGNGRRDIAQFIALPSLAELRTPAAKRSLWPRLRALRKTPPA